MDKLSSENKFAIMPEWVIELEISHTAFRLYAVLARYADNVTHQAFPSLETLSNRLGCSEKTVRRAIEDLVTHGAIKKHSRGRYNSNLYTVMTTPPEGSNMSHEGSEMSEEGTKMSTRLDKNVQVTKPTELEPKELKPQNDIVRKNSAYDSDFEEWWACYPRKKGKGDAAKAFKKALKLIDKDELIAKTIVFANDPNRVAQFTPYPERWLNEGRWDDEPEIPQHRKLTNAENAALLAQKYRGRDEAKAIEAPDVDFSGMLKGVQ